jgi:hypothetical protein
MEWAEKKIQGMIFLVVLLLCSSLSVAPAPAYSWDSARLQAGLDFFPSFLAADKKIKEKTDLDGYLTLVVLYQDSEIQAKKIAAHLRKVGKIRRLPIRVVLSKDPKLSPFKKALPAGVFVSERSLEQFDLLLRWGEKNQRIVFSPFPGDVERGLFGGIAVREMVLPLVNSRALDRWGILLKPFFLRIAEHYDE